MKSRRKRGAVGVQVLRLLALGLLGLPGVAYPAIYSLAIMDKMIPGVNIKNTTVHGGLAFADLNMDGLLDIVLVNDPSKLPQVLKNRGYNPETGYYQFEEVVGALPQPGGAGSGSSPNGIVVVGDYDNDGDLDIFVSSETASNSLWVWRNELVAVSGATPFQFTHVSTELGLGSSAINTYGPLVGVALADVDADGDLDLLVDSASYTKRLFLNRKETGTVQFQVASSSALVDPTATGHDVGFADFNLDGYPDIFGRSASTSATTDVLYFNKGASGPGTFFDATTGSSLRASFDSVPAIVVTSNDFSSAVVDYDNSGTWDLLFQNRNTTTGGTAYKTRFFVGTWSASATPAFVFSNKNGSTGVGVELPSTDAADFGGGVAFGDMDHDGLIDLFVGSPHPTLPDKIYKNLGSTSSGKPYQFTELSGETLITSNSSGDTDAVALADWDNDGDLDLYLNNGGSEAIADTAFLNNTIQSGMTNPNRNFLRVQVTCYNRDCLGASVQLFRAGDLSGDRFPDVYQPGYSSLSPAPFNTLSNSVVTGSLVGMRQVSGGAGIGAQESLLLHFGLPAQFKNTDGTTTAAGVDGLYTLRVLFPGGKVLLRDVQPSASTGLWHGLSFSNFVRVDMGDAAEDGDGLPAALEASLGTSNTDLDSDDDGLMDTTEYLKLKTDPAKQDSDNDGLEDGLELGVVSGISDPDGTGALVATNASRFTPDGDAATKTDPLKSDSDTDGLGDGLEDVDLDGRYDYAGVQVETDPLDMDSDEDGIFDGSEVNGYTWSNGATTYKYFSNPRAPDSDQDELLDGTEVGLVKSMDLIQYKDAGSFPVVEGVRVQGTDLAAKLFVADKDSTSSTNPSFDDSDTDGLTDGFEDANQNGIYEGELLETDPADAHTDGACDSDGEELTRGTDPRNPDDDTCSDPDGDLCDNLEELALGTDPYKADTDNDWIPDCVEGQVTADSSPVCPDPTNADSDSDGLPDGVEDHNQNGAIDATDTNPCYQDSDADGLKDGVEDSSHNGGVDPGESNPLDSDSDDDGLLDGSEDRSANGQWDPSYRDGKPYGETRAADWDTDDDGLSDGLEVGLLTPEANSTNIGSGHWFWDYDPTTTTNPNVADTDADGLLDGEEDRNHSGQVDGAPLNESDPNRADTDGDSCNDGYEVLTLKTSPTDKDSDDDGIEDCAEVSLGTSPTSSDTDGDGLSDGAEVSPPEGVSVTDPLDFDTDGDGLTDGTEVNGYFYAGDVVYSDPADPDSDNDLLLDGEEVANSTEPTNPTLVDTDGDGLDDYLETRPACLTDADNPDTDSDGSTDDVEDPNLNCVHEAGETSATDDDSDDDGLVDGAEHVLTSGGDGSAPDSQTDTSTEPLNPDTDGDGLLDGLERGLVVPQGTGTDLSVFKADADPTTQTNPLLVDTDDDGLSDPEEDQNQNGKVDAELAETDPTLADTDGGCQKDGAERDDGLNPLDPLDDACADPDGDLLTNFVERMLSHTNPFDADSDDDGVLDGREPCWTDVDGDGKPDAFDDDGDGTSTSVEKGDPDGDGLSCALDADSDNDGLLDGTELGLTLQDLDAQLTGEAPSTLLTWGAFVADADPLSRTNPLRADSNQDGQDDGANDPNHNGKLEPELGEQGEATKSTTSLTPVNPVRDCFAGTAFVDTDCDGLSDAEEAVLNVGRILPALDPQDADSDDDGIPDGEEANWSLDTDQDGLINARDPDSDNDGILDGTEVGRTSGHADTRIEAGVFKPDADPLTRTSAIYADSDFGGQPDGSEDVDYDGRQSAVLLAGGDLLEASPLDPADDLTSPKSDQLGCGVGTVFLDQDCDGLTDAQEELLTSRPLDDDSDDDGVLDGREPNHSVDTDGDGLPGLLDADADGDTLPDGLEMGLETPQGTGTDLLGGHFVADLEPSTRTSAVCADSDGGGVSDGEEDLNGNGRMEPEEGETNPTVPQDDCDDADEDGIETCMPAGEPVDCNDQNAQIFPGADELCDGLDNDCDGLADEDLFLHTFYLDQDEDGYGSPSAPATSCADTMDGHVSDNTDCDDSSAQTHPGAVDGPNDTVDQDCDGTATTPEPTSEPTVTATPEECTEETPCSCRCDVGARDLPRPPLGLLLVMLPLGVLLGRRRTPGHTRL